MKYLSLFEEHNKGKERYLKLLSRKYFDYHIGEYGKAKKDIKKYLSEAQVLEFIQNNREDDINWVDSLYKYLKSNFDKEYDRYMNIED